MNKHLRIAQLQNEPRRNRGIYAMLTGLLSGRLDRAKLPDRLPRLPVGRFTENRREAVLRAIHRTELAFGEAALTDGERIVWNAGLVLAIFTETMPNVFQPSAEVRSWPAARRGFVAMGLPDAAGHVAVLVKELAYRSERPRRSRDEEEASLLRLAGLKRRFREITAEHDALLMLDGLIERIYPWPD